METASIRKAALVLWGALVLLAARIQLPTTWAGDALLLAIGWSVAYPLVASSAFAEKHKHWEARYVGIFAVMLIGTALLRLTDPPFIIQAVIVVGILGIGGGTLLWQMVSRRRQQRQG